MAVWTDTTVYTVKSYMRRRRPPTATITPNAPFKSKICQGYIQTFFCEAGLARLSAPLLTLVVQARAFLQVKSGIITSSRISFSDNPTAALKENRIFDDVLRDKKMIEINGFHGLLKPLAPFEKRHDIRRLSAWLDVMLGKSGGLI